MPNKLLEVSGEITPERMKRISKRGNDAQFWMCLVVKVKSFAVKNKNCIGTCNVRCMNQGKLEVVKQEMARVNIDILGISKLKWVNLTQMTITSTTVGKNPLEEME